MKIFRLFEGLIDRAVVVLGAFLGSQLPSFVQQYTQRLAGHVEELNHILKGITEMASQSGKTIEQYIEKFTSSVDQDFMLQGQLMQNLLQRWQELSKALNELSASTVWNRFYIFIKNLNYEIAESTFYSFQPSVALTIEGISYTVIGMIGTYLLYQLTLKCFKALLGPLTSASVPAWLGTKNVTTSHN